MHKAGARIVINDLLNLPARLNTLKWEPFRDGIKIHRLYGNQTEGSSAALLWYEPGATLPRHKHVGYEHLIILDQVQKDDFGDHHAGTLIVNPPGSEHAVTNPLGAVVLAIWEKPVSFDL